MSYAKVRAILDASTPGRWEWRYGSLYPPKAQPGAEPVELGEGAAFYGIWPILSGENAEPDARAIVVARNLATELLAVAEAADEYSPERDHDWRCEYRTAEAGWQPGDSPVIRCECGHDDLRAALDALHAKMRETL